MAEVVRNKQVIFKDYINGYPKASNMVVTSDSTIRLELPKNEDGLILTKNLYLSCDPYMRNRMVKFMEGNYIDSFTLGSVCFNFETRCKSYGFITDYILKSLYEIFT